MERQKLKHISVLTFVLLSTLAFQNCSKVAFDTQPVAALSATQTGGVDQACVEQSGVSHPDGSKWTEDKISAQSLACPDGSSKQSNLTTTTSFLCVKSNIITTDSSTQSSATATCNTPPKSCVDATGVTHKSGETWKTTSDVVTNKPCDLDPQVNQKIITNHIQSFLCTNGVQSQTASSDLINQASNLCPVCLDKPVQGSSLPLCNPSCQAADGSTHANNTSWTVVTQTSKKVSCPNSSDLNQNYLNTQVLNCSNGQVVDGGSTSVATSPNAVCPQAGLVATVDSANPKLGATDNLNIVSQSVSDISYSCRGADNSVAQGAVAMGAQSIPLTVNSDTVCSVTATGADSKNLSASVSMNVDCGNKIKDGGICVDFGCKEVQQLALPSDGSTLTIPARSNKGYCYSIKLLDAIANSDSKLTSQHDDSILSRDHDGPNEPSRTSHPYLLGRKNLSFIELGPRNIKLAGGNDAQSPILVDNYVLVGIAPQGAAVNNSFYKSYGTADAVITLAGDGNILFGGMPLGLQSFGPGGTSTVAPLDITSNVSANTTYNLDFRAEDCGGVRELSDIYLLFQ